MFNTLLISHCCLCAVSRTRRFHDDRYKHSASHIYLPLTVVHFARLPPAPGTQPKTVATGFTPIPDLLLSPSGHPIHPPPAAAATAAAATAATAIPTAALALAPAAHSGSSTASHLPPSAHGHPALHRHTHNQHHQHLPHHSAAPAGLKRHASSSSCAAEGSPDPDPHSPRPAYPSAAARPPYSPHPKLARTGTTHSLARSLSDVPHARSCPARVGAPARNPVAPLSAQHLALPPPGTVYGSAHGGVYGGVALGIPVDAAAAVAVPGVPVHMPGAAANTRVPPGGGGGGHGASRVTPNHGGGAPPASTADAPAWCAGGSPPDPAPSQLLLRQVSCGSSVLAAPTATAATAAAVGRYASTHSRYASTHSRYASTHSLASTAQRLPSPVNNSSSSGGVPAVWNRTGNAAAAGAMPHLDTWPPLPPPPPAPPALRQHGPGLQADGRGLLGSSSFSSSSWVDAMAAGNRNSNGYGNGNGGGGGGIFSTLPYADGDGSSMDVSADQPAEAAAAARVTAAAGSGITPGGAFGGGEGAHIWDYAAYI